jgi:diacylglycerol kinase family enzyme
LRVLAINNVRSGQGETRRYELIGELCRRGVETTVRAVGGEASVDEALSDAAEFDAVVVLGGDGTISAAAYALRGTGTPLLPFPAGTANAVALNLGITSDPVRCADIIVAGHTARIDLGEIVCETQHRPPKGLERRRSPRTAVPLTTGFVVVAGVGFDADMIERGAELKQQFGAAAYLVAALQNASPRMARIELELDGVSVETEGSGVLLVNFGRMQFDISATHDSDASDGMIEVVVIKARHIAELLPAVAASYLDLFVEYPSRTQVLDAYRAREVRIRCVPPMRAQADGEVLAGATPMTCTVLPGAATFLVPEAPGPITTGT